MYFITNRALKQSHRSRANRTVDFDLDNAEPQASVFFCEATKNGIVELTSGPFLERLRSDACDEVLVFVHGFNVTPEAALKSGEKLQKLADEYAEGRLLVLPLIWPSDNKMGIIRDYYDDQDAADGSAIGYARVLGKFLDWRREQTSDVGCLKRIHLLAHSMGARVSAGTLTRWRERQRSLPRILRHAFLLAPDIPNESLERGDDAAAIVDSARTVTVYHAEDDLAVRASKVANVANQELTKRLGHTGPEDMNRTASHVFAVDCSDFNFEEDKLGHSYWGGAAFRHMMYTVRTDRVDVSERFVVPDNHPRAVRLLGTYPTPLDSPDDEMGERNALRERPNRPHTQPV